MHARRLHPRYRREWRLAPGSSLQLERADAGAGTDDDDDGGDGRDGSADISERHPDGSYYDYHSDDDGGVAEGSASAAAGQRRRRQRGQSVGVTLNL